MTPMMCMLQDLMERNKNYSNVARVYFVWVMKRPGICLRSFCNKEKSNLLGSPNFGRKCFPILQVTNPTKLQSEIFRFSSCSILPTT